MELAAARRRLPRSGGLTLPRVDVVLTAAAVAARLGVSEDLVRLMAEQMSDEDGCILVLGVTEEDWTPAFTRHGIDALQELITASSQLDLDLTTPDPRP